MRRGGWRRAVCSGNCSWTAQPASSVTSTTAASDRQRSGAFAPISLHTAMTAANVCCASDCGLILISRHRLRVVPADSATCNSTPAPLRRGRPLQPAVSLVPPSPSRQSPSHRALNLSNCSISWPSVTARLRIRPCSDSCLTSRRGCAATMNWRPCASNCCCRVYEHPKHSHASTSSEWLMRSLCAVAPFAGRCSSISPLFCCWRSALDLELTCTRQNHQRKQNICRCW